MVLHDLPGLPTFNELSERIQDDISHFGGSIPERYVIAWRGYIAALSEWGLISIRDHDRLCELLPPVEEPDPVVSILVGRVDGNFDDDSPSDDP